MGVGAEILDEMAKEGIIRRKYLNLHLKGMKEPQPVWLSWLGTVPQTNRLLA